MIHVVTLADSVVRINFFLSMFRGNSLEGDT